MAKLAPLPSRNTSGTSPEALGRARASEDVQSRILDRLEALERKLDAILAPAQSDHALMLRLAPAIVGCVGTEPFAASEVLDYPAVRVILPHVSPGSLGKYLGRMQGHLVADYRVERIGRLWRMQIVQIT